MTSKQYFEHLCRSEAGEFIFRTVKDVEGLMMLRPREALTDAMLMDRYALEDPYGAVLSSLSKPEDYYVQPTIGRYKYLEVPTNLSSDLGVGDSFIRYFRSTAPTSPKPVPGVLNGKTAMLPYVVAKSEVEGRKSSYGFIWRGVRREKDRDLGIAGGELIVIALESRDVLAVRRGYIRSGHARNTPTGVWWLGGQLCGNTKNLREHRFVTKVLVPAK